VFKMPSFDVPFEFEVYCGTCGAGLCCNSREGYTTGRSYPYISVDACDACIERAKEDGFDEGYEKRDSEIE
jgi:hypothetical protein